MGTNYYLHKKQCPTCKRQDIVHIGKSSAGWPFAFASDDMGKTIEEVRKNLKGKILDEYGRPMSRKKFLEYVESRTFRERKLGYDFHAGDFT